MFHLLLQIPLQEKKSLFSDRFHQHFFILSLYISVCLSLSLSIYLSLSFFLSLYVSLSVSLSLSLYLALSYLLFFSLSLSLSHFLPTTSLPFFSLFNTNPCKLILHCFSTFYSLLLPVISPLGTAMGDDSLTGRPVMIRSGRFGRYVQIGLDAEKNKTTHCSP